MRVFLASFFYGKVLCGGLRGSFLSRKLPLTKAAEYPQTPFEREAITRSYAEILRLRLRLRSG